MSAPTLIPYRPRLATDAIRVPTPGDAPEAGHRLPRARAARRVAAYVYGSIVVLGVLVAIPPEAAADSRALLVLAGSTVSTLVAHVVASLAGHRLHGPLGRRQVLAELRDALPILVSGVIPGVVLGLAVAGLLPASAALLAACGTALVRVAATPLVTAHLRGETLGARLLVPSIALGVAGLAAVALKTIAHLV